MIAIPTGCTKTGIERKKIYITPQFSFYSLESILEYTLESLTLSDHAVIGRNLKYRPYYHCSGLRYLEILA